MVVLAPGSVWRMSNRNHYVTSVTLQDEGVTTISPGMNFFETGVMWRGNLFDFVKRSKFMRGPEVISR